MDSSPRGRGAANLRPRSLSLALRSAPLQRPCREFSHRIQLDQGLKRPNFCLHNPLFCLSETHPRHPPRNSPSCSPRCPVRCSPHCSDGCGPNRSARCSAGCGPGYGLSCGPRYSLRCSTRCSTGRSDRRGLSSCPHCSLPSSDSCSPDCQQSSFPRCSPGRSVSTFSGRRASIDLVFNARCETGQTGVSDLVDDRL
jgi:hypothetical protein